jgi:hypothetical protein
MHNKANNLYSKEVRQLFDKIEKCARLVKRCDALIKDSKLKRIKDSKLKRHSHTGKQAATTPEIVAVIEIRTGVRPSQVKRTNYTTNVNPDHSVTIVEKKQGAVPLTATNAELNDYFAKNFGQGTIDPNIGVNADNPALKAVKNISNTTVGASNNPSAYTQQVAAQENSKLTQAIAELTKIVGLIAAITATLGAIRVGPAVETIQQAAEAFRKAGKTVSDWIKNLQKAYQKRQKANAAKAAKTAQGTKIKEWFWKKGTKGPKLPTGVYGGKPFTNPALNVTRR